MSGQSANSGQSAALDAMSGRATQASRTTYLVLLTSAPAATTTLATMSELDTPGSNGYHRQAVTWTTPASDGAGGFQTHNSGAVTFGPFTVDEANVPYCALVSAATGTTGDFIYYWTLDTARNPANGDSIQFAVGGLVMDVV